MQEASRDRNIVEDAEAPPGVWERVVRAAAQVGRDPPGERCARR